MKNLILLTVENSTNIGDIITWVFGAVVLVCMFLYVRKERMEKGNTEALEKYLKDISDIVRKRIIEFITNFDLSTYKEDFQTLQADLLNGLYDDIYELSMNELESIMGNDSVSMAIVKKALTRDKIEEYVALMLEDNDLKSKFTGIINSVLEKENERIEAEDKALEKELGEYENDSDDPMESKVAELDPTVVKDPEKPTISEVINPPRDEEEEVISADDESVEIIGDVEENNAIFE